MNSAFLFIAKKANEFKLKLNSLYDIYLPIIGQTATNFYMILCNIVENNSKNHNLTFNSQSICNQLGVDQDKLFDAKNKLEAIGLLSTFISTNINKDNILILVVKPALSFREFIQNPKFKQLLINKIGNQGFEYLEYKDSDDTEVQESVEITTTFENVFDDNQIRKLKSFDFEQLYKNIQLTTSLPLVIDENCKNIIQDIFNKYHIDVKSIEMVIYDSINCIDGYNNVNPNLLLQNFNKLINNQVSFALPAINRDAKIFYGQLTSSEEEKILMDYKMCNSELYLSSIFKRPLKQSEKDLIATLRSKFYLKDEIINLLIDFSLTKTNGKLNKKYLFKTANSINGLGLIETKQIINHFKKVLVDKKIVIEEDDSAYFTKGF